MTMEAGTAKLHCATRGTGGEGPLGGRCRCPPGNQQLHPCRLPASIDFPAGTGQAAAHQPQLGSCLSKHVVSSRCVQSAPPEAAAPRSFQATAAEGSSAGSTLSSCSSSTSLSVSGVHRISVHQRPPSLQNLHRLCSDSGQNPTIISFALLSHLLPSTLFRSCLVDSRFFASASSSPALPEAFSHDPIASSTNIYDVTAVLTDSLFFFPRGHWLSTHRTPRHLSRVNDFRLIPPSPPPTHTLRQRTPSKSLPATNH